MRHHGWFLVLLLTTPALAGCELVASAMVEKQWVTEPLPGGKPDMTTRFELKATKLIGRDAKVAKLKRENLK